MSVFEIRLDDHASSKRKARRRSASVPDASEPVPENQPARLADDELDPALRPKRLEDFIGQPQVTELLSVAIEAAKQRGEPLDHLLFYGPPGLGKTTIAQIVANEMGVAYHAISAPAIEKPSDLVAALTTLQYGDVLFIDEIHRLKPIVEEFLYPAMEDGRIDIRVEEGPRAHTVSLPVNRFTLIGATTRLGMLTAPLRARFGLVCRLDFYSPEDLTTILCRNANLLGIDLTSDAALELARRARGTPRIANRLLRRARDYATVRGNGVIDLEAVREAMAIVGVDERGLTESDRSYLRALLDLYDGGPVGLKTLAAALNEDPQTLEDAVEPFLIQLGLIERTPRGRRATSAAESWFAEDPA